MKHLFFFIPLLATASITVKPLNDFWFEADYTTGSQVAVAGSETPSTIEDITFNVSTSDTLVEQYTLFANPTYLEEDLEYTESFSSNTPAVATIDASTGVTTYVSDGTANFTVTVNGLSRSTSVTFVSVAGSTHNDFDSFAAGSARKAAYDAINGVIASAADNLLYDTASHPTYTRNASHWMAGWDKSSISPRNSRGGHTRGGTLITPRHVLTAAHYPIYVGDTITFVSDDGNNTVWTATVQAESRNTTYDFQVLLLDAEAATAFNPMKVLPADFANYMPATLDDGEVNEDPAFLLPVVARNQDRKLHLSGAVDYIFDVSWDSKAGDRVQQLTSYEDYPFDNSNGNYITSRVGDSGSPKMTTFDTSELVLLFANWGATTGYSAGKGNALDDLIKAVDAKAGISSYNGAGSWSAWPNDAGSYQTQGYDLSAFTDYTAP